ncbi:RDD family protein [Arthrobacter sp. zg-Y769]|uniref:RDD family protein n=1 Tax=Arthrobacter sp. zg-Y769 TaxID=2894191 RepID=UPI001E5031AE|nr:RDD family protein [Arthrobacter sp. zg-Y769]MCC9205389.1 RDD family protein [Arthrobacter sp. zg-Y769]
MSSIVTGEAVVLELRPAGFAARMVSALIDVTVQVLVFFVLMLLVLSAVTASDPALAQALSLSLVVLLFVVVPAAVETLTRGKSLGRLVMGLRIVRDDGGSVRFRHAFIRAFTAVLEIYMLAGSLAFMVALFNDKSKRLGDLMAGTYALRDRVVAPLPQPVQTPPELAGWAALADIGRLPDGLARRISRFLAQSRHMTGSARTVLAAELASETTSHVSPQPPPGTHPEAYLRAVTAERRNRDYVRLDRQRGQSKALGERLHRMPFSE